MFIMIEAMEHVLSQDKGKEQQLIELAKKMQQEQKCGVELHLSEVAFYDALADNVSAKQVLGDETLRKISKRTSRHSAEQYQY